MKRLLLAFGLLVILLIVGAFLAVTFLLGSILKKGVETAGPLITKVDVRLDGASLALLSGGGELKGLVIGNPEGFKAPSAIKVGAMRVGIDPRSLFADKVVIHSIKVLSPEITFEGGLQKNNLGKLLENVRGPASQGADSSTQQNKAASRKLQVDDILISGGKINLSVGLLGGMGPAVPLPDIHIANLGQGPGGITAAELAERLLNAILDKSTQAVAGQLGSVGKTLGTAASSFSTGDVQQVQKAVKGLTDLLKR